jgi:hypothetical protein
MSSSTSFRTGFISGDIGCKTCFGYFLNGSDVDAKELESHSLVYVVLISVPTCMNEIIFPYFPEKNTIFISRN